MVPVIAYDVNETLSDTSSLRARFAEVGAPEHLADTWFAATLRDGSALSMAGTPRPYGEIARGVLDVLWADVEAVTDPVAASNHVLDGFWTLETHPDVVPGIRALAAAGHRQVTLTNGSLDVSRSVLERAGVDEHIERFLSVNDAGAWKPDPRAYEYLTRSCRVAPEQIVLVAVFPWDIHGARQAGLRTAFVDRAGAPWPPSFDQPEFRIAGLAELAALLR